MRRKDYPEAIRRFEGAIDLDARAVPAYLNLGDVRVAQGKDQEAGAIWERLVDVAPDRAYLAFDRLESLAVRTGAPERFAQLCRRLIDDNPQDWRARLALSRHLAASGRPHDALDLLFAALVQNPHALGIHQAIWRALGQLRVPAAARRPLRRADASTRSSISTRTSACAAATAAPSCSGSARTATTGIRSSKSASRPRRTLLKSKLKGAVSRQTALVCGISAGLSVLMCAPLFVLPNGVGHYDWDQHTFYYASVLRSVVEYGQWPFWNPWSCGGNVLWQNPQVPLLSPAYPLALVFSLPLAMKVNVVVHYWIGFVGMHLLVRQVAGVRFLPLATYLSCVFVASGALALHIAEGHAVFLPAFFLPLLLYWLCRAMSGTAACATRCSREACWA